ncbi:prolipoprotein diacylglyceryl transferase [Candidatus Chloroploca sp. M-50]|uniref:Phosphatidylglycerol--prolipoprotein diacylglyceryl transferase n=1 Tax=Candidatus Chloroploca mongolica TaxID=2528176 RepID=A0ABS4DG13_9CHLR|nr:prolipoprotein diacylglyceryl transferase [Candidatus Chloroploca mongolica]MBP1468360.1 prolipoprotein diacylglyceryl transferase [Candidatus Chloroploca mongolica]
MILYPPDDPFLFYFTLFGLPIAVRWYGVLIMGGALLGAYLASRRAVARGYDPDHVWNQLMLGLIMGIAGARIYYVIFEWERFAPNPWSVLNLTTGGLAIHGGLIGAVLSVLIYTRWNRLPFWEWLDICVPGFLLGQAIGRWGNFFNQEAYGRPTDLPFGVRIDADRRLPPYTNLQEYPLDTVFHATFLYESVWNFIGVGLLLLLDRQLGHGAPPKQRRLRPGDLFFIYAIFYSAGRFWIEGLRLDSLYLGPLRTAQVVSLVLMSAGVVGLLINHWRRPSRRA